MDLTWIALAVWAAILLAAVPYVLWAKHPQQRPVAAYLIFMTVFSAVVFALFFLLWWLAGIAGIADALSGLGGAALILLLSVAPAVLLARWQIRKPPRRPPAI